MYSVYIYMMMMYKRVPSSCCSYVYTSVCVCRLLCAAVLPNRVDHARPLAMSVRRDVWDTYQQRWASPLSILLYLSFLLSFHLFCRLVTFPPFPPMFIHRYGGGPMVQKLEICSVCKDLLDSYTEQRKREKEEIHKVCS